MCFAGSEASKLGYDVISIYAVVYQLHVSSCALFLHASDQFVYIFLDFCTSGCTICPFFP